MRLCPPDAYYQRYDAVADNASHTSYLVRALSQARSELVSWWPASRSLQIIMLGSATERNITELSSFVEENTKLSGHRYVFLDIAEHTLHRHQQLVRQKERPDVFVVQGDMNAAPLPSHTADFVVMDYTINFNESWLDYGRTIRSIARLLRPQGRCLLSLIVNNDGEKGPVVKKLDTVTLATMARSDVLALLKSCHLSFQIISRPEERDTSGWPIMRLIIQPQLSSWPQPWHLRLLRVFLGG